MSVLYSQYGVMVRGGGGEPFSPSSIVNIVPINKMVVVDKNGYIGYDITNYFQARGGTYSYNYAILDNRGNYSQSELGQVTFYTPAGNVIGGREYRTVVIGGKEWMAENLDFKFSGLAVGQSGTSTSEPRGNYYNNNETTYGKYGILYNGVAVNYLEANKSSLIPGWHVATADEWSNLATAVGGIDIAGTKLKSTMDWSSGAGTDDYGFSVLPGGSYSDMAIFDFLGSRAYFWSSTLTTYTTLYRVRFDSSASMSEYNDTGFEYQFSLRLVKDSV